MPTVNFHIPIFELKCSLTYWCMCQKAQQCGSGLQIGSKKGRKDLDIYTGVSIKLPVQACVHFCAIESVCLCKTSQSG